jgi:hypothetical protein
MVLLSSAAPAEDYFHGYTCTVDCSGHEAGYRWEERHDITDPDDCGGNSNSFTEGCRSWAEEQADDPDQDQDEDLDQPGDDDDSEQ